MQYLKALGVLLASPVIGGAAGLGVSFLGHWLSGESQDIASGQPWIMMSMLFIPVGALAGFITGVVAAIQCFKKGL